MKTKFFTLLAAIGCSVSLLASVNALPGVFTVSATKKVRFAKGNLQYQMKDAVWRFAENQYDVMGEANLHCGDKTYDGYIDLFGRSTVNNYYGVNTSNDNSLYDGTFVDWGNVFAESGWAALTYDEWNYMMYLRPNAQAPVVAAVKINGNRCWGCFWFPDDWVTPAGISLESASSFPEYSLAEFKKLEDAGAVFFPQAGYRYYGIDMSHYEDGQKVIFKDADSPYRLADKAGAQNNTRTLSNNLSNPSYGYPVRLAWDIYTADATAKTITYTASAKLTETTSTNNSGSGLHTKAFGDATISKHEFSNGKGTITFSKAVPKIGDYAFYGCSGMTGVSLPHTASSIGKEAFNGCSKLQSITIPQGVKSIGGSAFLGCSSVTEYLVEEGNQYYCSENGVLLRKRANDTRRTLLNFPVNGSLTTYVVPADVDSIGAGAFYNATKLKSVTIASITWYIDFRAFYGCTALTDITHLGKGQWAPVLGTQVFTGVNKSTATLHVLESMVSLFKGADQWKDFVNIDAVHEDGVWIGGEMMTENSNFVRQPETFVIGYYPNEDKVVIRGNAAVGYTIKSTTGKTKIVLDHANMTIINNDGYAIEFSDKLTIEGTGFIKVYGSMGAFSSNNVALKDGLMLSGGDSFTDKNQTLTIAAGYDVFVDDERLTQASDYVINPNDLYIGYYPEKDSLVVRNLNKQVSSIRSTTGNTSLTITGSNYISNVAGPAIDFANRLRVHGTGSLTLSGTPAAFSSTAVNVDNNLTVYGALDAAAVLIEPTEPMQNLGTGRFAVSATKSVQFTMGNLMLYKAVGGFKLAPSQYYSSVYNNDERWMVHLPLNADGYAGVAIANINTNGLHSLSEDEWNYLLNKRTYGLYLHGNAVITYGENDSKTVNGFVLLPDNWNLPAGLPAFVASATNGDAAQFTDNVYNLEEWEQMEAAGAVFLPALGLMINNTLSFPETGAYIATSGTSGDKMVVKSFSRTDNSATDLSTRDAVNYRLVRDANASAVETVDNAQCTMHKYIRDGQVYIVRDGKTYNALGVEVR